MKRCNLKKLMQKKNISIKELSKISGLKEQTIKKYCDDKIKIIRFATLDKLCKALDCKTNNILITKTVFTQKDSL